MMEQFIGSDRILQLLQLVDMAKFTIQQLQLTLALAMEMQWF